MAVPQRWVQKKRRGADEGEKVGKTKREKEKGDFSGQLEGRIRMRDEGRAEVGRVRRSEERKTWGGGAGGKTEGEGIVGEK